MSKKQVTVSKEKVAVPSFDFVTEAGGVTEYRLKSNSLRVLYVSRPGTGVVTTNVTYFVGSRDEARGETGAAHMLEHMLFKPTVQDIKAKIDSASMKFERETGCTLNANTWKDRTTYFFCYPTEHFERALKIEAERMNGVVLTDESLNPERDNVLSEHDMYNGDPYFALTTAMISSAFYSHPYGHETIGHREDIEKYTAKTLERFYRTYYRPDNAVLMVIGDVEEKFALQTIKKLFSPLQKPTTAIPRFKIVEPKQEGLRRVNIERPSETNIVSIGLKSPAFPSSDWYDTSMLLEALCGGPESILHKALVDTGLATTIDSSLEPASEQSLAIINVTLAPLQKHQVIEDKILALINSITLEQISSLVKKAKAKVLTEELFARDSSLQIAAELTEYVSAGDWTIYNKTPAILEAITPKKVLALTKLFNNKNLTIGYFIGTKQ